MSMTNTLFVGLMTLACVSPLLTLLHLWQMKEWRWDRLFDQLRTEGWFKQLFGYSRPVVALVWGIPLVYFSLLKIAYWKRPDLFSSEIQQFLSIVLYLLFFYAGSLAALTILQIVLRKQPKPVWTKKAQLMFVVSSILTITILSWSSIFLHIVDYTPRIVAALAMPFLMPLVIACAWTVLKPVDHVLKQRILARAAMLRAEHPNLTVIGITGSVGKTTTKELLRHLLEPRGAIATPEHVNSEMGVASWLSRTLRDEPVESKRILIVEMGAYRIGEIALLAATTQPSIGVLTFVGRQHSALFGGEEAIARAKSELLSALPKSGHAFINADSPRIDIIKKNVVSDVTYVGTDARASVRALDIEETGKGLRFRFDETVLEVPLAGTHNVTNILLAVCVAKSLGVSIDEISKRLQSFSAFERTFQRREQNGIVILDNTYNASVESFIACIDWAERQEATERVLLFDGIIELGDDEERLHRMIAEKVAKNFEKAYVIHRRFLRYFQPFFGDRVMLVPEHPAALPTGTLLVCMGRMSPKIIEKFVRNEE